MAIAVHTGVGYGAIRPSGRSVQPNGLADFAFVHPGQYGTQETLVFSDSGTVSQSTYPTYIDSVFTPYDSAFGNFPNRSNTDSFTLADAGAQTNAGYPTFQETPFTPTDNASGNLTPGANTDTVVETMFGAVKLDGVTEQIIPTDNPSQNISYNATRTDSAPLKDSSNANHNPGANDTIPIADNPTHP